MGALPRATRGGWTFAVTFAAAVACRGGDAEPPVVWAASIDGADVVGAGSVVRVRIDAKPTDSWYFYSLTQPAGGPIPTRIRLADSSVFTHAGAATGPPPTTSFDNTFRIDVEKYPGPASFILPIRVPPRASGSPREISVSALYQACNDTVCLSPKEVVLTVPLRIAPR